MAIGQLLDYSYHGFEPDGRKALLLPGAPPEDFAEVLGYFGRGVARELQDGTFVEDYPWL